jgi:hypothetical protein
MDEKFKTDYDEDFLRDIRMIARSVKYHLGLSDDEVNDWINKLDPNINMAITLCLLGDSDIGKYNVRIYSTPSYTGTIGEIQIVNTLMAITGGSVSMVKAAIKKSEVISLDDINKLRLLTRVVCQTAGYEMERV